MNAEFLKALLALKKELGPIAKTSQGHRSKYADLAEVHRAVDDKVHEHGFVLTNTFRVENGETLMDATLWHEHGHLTSTLPLSIQQIDKMNYYQALGSAITYERRYALMALLSLPAEDDDGASAAQKPARGNGQKVAPKNTEDKKREFLSGTDYTLSTKGAMADPNMWADKFCELVPLIADAATLDKLSTDNGKHLEFLRMEHNDVYERINNARLDAHAFFQSARTLAAE